MVQQLCEPHHLILIICVLLLAFVALGGGKGLGSILNPLCKRIFGKEAVTINLGEKAMGSEKGVANCAGCEAGKIPANCPEHTRVQAFIVESERDRTELFRKVNRLDRRSAKLEVMVEMLLKARGLEVDFSKVDLKLEEDAEG